VLSRAFSRELRAAATFLAGGLALAWLYPALPHGAPQSVVYDVLGIGSSAAIGWGALRNRPSFRLPWLLFALGNLSFAVADVIFDVLVDPPVPSVADAFYLGGYPLLAAGLILLVVRAGGLHRVAALADAAIVTVAFTLAQWAFAVDRLVENGGPAAARIVDSAYPLMDVLLLACLAGFFVTAAWRTPAFLLLVGSIACMLVSDEIYGVAPSSYVAGKWLDVGWLLSYVLWGAAALHPSMRALSLERDRDRDQPHAGPLRFALLVAALVTAPVVLFVQHLRHVHLDVSAVAIAGAAVSVLVVLRLAGIMRALERTKAQLLEADRLKDEFVALISHDLRTPLTSIMGYTELALDPELEPAIDDERRGYLDVVSRSSERLLRLVDDLLFVARLQAGRLDLSPTLLDLSELAGQAAREAQRQAGAKGVELVFEGGPGVKVDADKGRMFQLLDNLVSNALKFTPSGGRVEISVAQNGRAVLEVRDTGIGLTSDEAAHVFDRFFRSDNAVTAQVPGTGLGLFIAHAITEAHGGTISAAPRVGGGAAFTVELPRANGDDSSEWQCA
jgi:signal transduction histidine kinase